MRHQMYQKGTSVYARGTTLLARQNFSGTYTDWIYTLYIQCIYMRTHTLHECSLALALATNSIEAALYIILLELS